MRAAIGRAIGRAIRRLTSRWALVIGLLTGAAWAQSPTWYFDPALLDDPKQLARSARLVPFKDDQHQGFKVAGVRSGSLAREAGLRSGDVLLAVDDRALGSPQQLIALASYLKTRQEVVVHVLRRGKETRWTVRLATPPLRVMQLKPDVYALPAGALDDPRLLGKTGVVPHRKDGAAHGVRLTGVTPDSVADQLGLKTGDIITALNGQPIHGPLSALKTLPAIRAQKTITLSVEQAGAARSITVHLAPTPRQPRRSPKDGQYLDARGRIESRVELLGHDVSTLDFTWHAAALVDDDFTWRLGTLRFKGPLKYGAFTGEATFKTDDLQGQCTLRHGRPFLLTCTVTAAPALDPRLKAHPAFNAQRQARLSCLGTPLRPRCLFGKIDPQRSP